MHILLLFIDGVGIGEPDPNRNPFFASRYPTLEKLLGGTLPSRLNLHIEAPHAICVPTNATLRVEGLPQSGTGQATLYTGVNCAKKIGKHFGPYLYSTLKPIVARYNIFSRIQEKDPQQKIALANAFPQRFFDYLASGKQRMVAGIYAAMQSNILLRTHTQLLHEEAVSTDITGARWRAFHHPLIPEITPYEAGRILASITRMHHFTLFEYFATDKAGHDRDLPMAIGVLTQIDELIAGLIDHSDLDNTLICITSDHGNIEDLHTKSHTLNPVPALLFGKHRRQIADAIHSLISITPAFVRLLTQ